MGASLWSAGYGTHLKIVLVSLIASIVVAVVGITGHLDREATARFETASSVLKAGVAKHYTGIGQRNIR
jgi:NO-binding membrane sensor protein with MHYT domain